MSCLTALALTSTLHPFPSPQVHFLVGGDWVYPVLLWPAHLQPSQGVALSVKGETKRKEARGGFLFSAIQVTVARNMPQRPPLLSLSPFGHQGGRIEIKESGTSPKDRKQSLFTLSRGHNRVRVDRKKGDIVMNLAPKLAESGEKAPNEGFYRLRALFPEAADDTLHTVRWLG